MGHRLDQGINSEVTSRSPVVEDADNNETATGRPTAAEKFRLITD
jgi:hypothetical protein